MKIECIKQWAKTRDWFEWVIILVGITLVSCLIRLGFVLHFAVKEYK